MDVSFRLLFKFLGGARKNKVIVQLMKNGNFPDSPEMTTIDLKLFLQCSNCKMRKVTYRMLSRFVLNLLHFPKINLSEPKSFSIALSRNSKSQSKSIASPKSLNQTQIQMGKYDRGLSTSRPTSESSSKELNLSSILNQSWTRPDLDLN